MPNQTPGSASDAPNLQSPRCAFVWMLQPPCRQPGNGAGQDLRSHFQRKPLRSRFIQDERDFPLKIIHHPVLYVHCHPGSAFLTEHNAVTVRSAAYSLPHHRSIISKYHLLRRKHLTGQIGISGKVSICQGSFARTLIRQSTEIICLSIPRIKLNGPGKIINAMVIYIPK